MGFFVVNESKINIKSANSYPYSQRYLNFGHFVRLSINENESSSIFSIWQSWTSPKTPFLVLRCDKEILSMRCFDFLFLISMIKYLDYTYLEPMMGLLWENTGRIRQWQSGSLSSYWRFIISARFDRILYYPIIHPFISLYQKKIIHSQDLETIIKKFCRIETIYLQQPLQWAPPIDNNTIIKRARNNFKMIRSEKDEYEQSIGLKFNEGQKKVTAFLTNFKTRTYIDVQQAEQRMALLCYFQDEAGSVFKCYYAFNPYFYVGFQQKAETQVRLFVESKVPKILAMETVEKVDLEEINHLSGRMKKYLKISFKTLGDLTNARKFLDIKKKKVNNDTELYMNPKKGFSDNPKDLITDIREYDVPYHCRVCIDTGIRAGKWFQIGLKDKFITSLAPSSKKSIPDLKVLAYDIETSKDPFKFPQKEKDVIMMISLMYQGEAVLIINNAFCSQKVDNFDYQPQGKPQFKCHVQVYNMPSEKDTIQMFADIIQNYKPTVITSFNGDKFDYPFIEARCAQNYLDFAKVMGVNNKSGEYFGAYVSHLDCYYWVDRDAYLPQGSRGLKAVTRAKLKYQPIEVDPEEMVEMGKHETRKLAEYSISDAVATFYLYMKHIHGFIYALSTIIPMMPDEVLRKGSGTLCENLLMAEAYMRNIIFPNKQVENFEKFYKGHLLESETYTGGKVQCLRSGIYRADFPTDFTLSPKAFQSLIDNIDQILQFTIHHQTSQSVCSIDNLPQIKQTISSALAKLKDVANPSKYETLPLIYHIDVAAMYPNIIITNRLQPVAVVNDRICSGCLFNSPQYDCKRSLEWEWRGDYFPLNEGEYALIKEKQALKLDPNNYNKVQQQKTLKNEVKKYCQRVYSKGHISISEVRRDTVCMRENSFYVDTVRAFRDRRYEYKTLTKVHKGKASQKAKQGKYEEQKQEIKLMELFESMQLAHKIILNSFYGYVMRKGSRWYSMETAAMVTYIGSNIINDSKNFIEARLGKPLELDTDGIWMLLPQGFPEQIKIKFKNGKSYNMSYPCQILNHLIYQKYANNQYQQLKNQQNFTYQIRKEMTIAFQIDGPYKAMFIPGGKEKKKTNELDIQQQSTQMLKKRYVVFNHKNQVSEFKGLEMKRRGELNIIKMFQSEIFGQYVKGTTLKECYKFCADVAMNYFNFILKKGEGLDLDGILERLEESKNLSKDANQYGESKGVGITAAKRLADYLGPEVVKGKNICLYYIISAYPPKKTVTERAIPTQIFFADVQTQRKYLYKWTKNDQLKNQQAVVDIRNILDWDYYKQRLSTQIQKMICIPAVMQNLANPIPEIQLPDWLQKKTFDMRFHRQEKISMYGFVKIGEKAPETERKGQTSHKKMLEQKKDGVMIEPKILFEQNKKTFLRKSHKNPYSMKTNFKQWLNSQKRIWKDHKREVIMNQSLKFHQLKSILQIIPIENSPGSFTVWYYSGNKIQHLLLNFKRHYYVKNNRGLKKAPREEGVAQEIILEQVQFLKMQDSYDTILGQTFYQTKIPLLTNLILKKGNLWKISKHLPLYREEDVHQVFGSEYLPKIEDNFMPTVYLSKICVLENKHMFALFSPKTLEYVIVYLDNSLGKNTDQLLRLARKTLKKEDANITIKIKHTERQVGKFLNQALKGLEKSLKQSFLVILQADCPVAHLRSIGIEALEQDMPVLKLQSAEMQKVTSLDWKQKLLIKSIQRSQNMDNKIVNLLEWSRFTHIPICNLAQQQSCLLDYITNITYGRLLHSGDYVSWWNDHNSEIIETYECKSQTGRILNSGLYTSYCVEINVDNLAVNTIANSDELGFEDRETAMMIQKNTGAGKKDNNAGAGGAGTGKMEYLDQMTQAKKAFEYLRKMIKGWIEDLNINLEKANDLLRNFHKWITTHSNALYDPLLFKFVNELMKKMFSILIRKLNNLGLHIIYASFSKIIVATDKHTYKQAQNTINYMLQKCASQNEKLFGYLALQPLDNYYQVLLYRDPLNFVGIFVSQHEGKNEIIGGGSMEDQGEQELQRNIEYSFEMARLFNPIVRFQFKNLVLQFVDALCQIKKSLIREYSQNKMKLMLNYESLITQRTIQYIESTFSQQLLVAIERVIENWETEKENNKKMQGTRVEGEMESEGDQDGDGEMDSFIVDDQEEVEDILSDSEGLDIKEEQTKKKPKNKQKGKAKNDPNEQNRIVIDFQVWGNDKQLDMLIETLFQLLNHDEVCLQVFDSLRRRAFSKIHQESSYTHRHIQPQYPHFQLPCSNCYLVNEKPGNCEHCHVHLDAERELQNAIWKMMQEQGRDLYCNRCRANMQGYLKKCRCGGKWELGELPLGWLPYMPRDDYSWDYSNRVFQFMGIK